MGMNYVAISVMTVVMFLLGWLWYSPVLFAKKWGAYLGIKPEEMGGNPEPMMFVRALVSNFVTVYVLARIIDYADVESAFRGALIGGMVAIGMTAAPNFNGQVNFLKKPVGLWLIDSGYIVVGSMIAGAVLAIWR